MKRISIAVIRTPHCSGIPNRSLSAIALPSTSAKSIAMIPISAKIHNVKFTGFE
jgi:hypothetical protein